MPAGYKYYIISLALALCALLIPEAKSSQESLKQFQNSFTPELIENPNQWNNWLSALINVHFRKPYEREPSRFIERVISNEKYVVYRPNHGLAHGMRQGFLAVNIVDGFEYINSRDFKSSETNNFIEWIQKKLKTDPYFRQKIQLTASFQRTGRESEDNFRSNFNLYQQYELQDSENFYNAAKNFIGPNSLFKDEEEVKLYKYSILKKAEIKDSSFSSSNKELRYLRRIIWTSHTLDLRRLIKSDFNEPTVIANATIDLFGPETAFADPEFKSSLVHSEFKKEGGFVKKLWEYSGKYLQATGDRANGDFEDKFFIQARHPDQMAAALIEANKSTNHMPHLASVFLYAACPVKLKRPISVKSKATEIQESKMVTLEPQPSQEWCVLLSQKKDGNYSVLGGRVSPFEEEFEAVRAQIQEESKFIYDLDPTTFDREKITPYKEESLEQMRERRSTNLPTNFKSINAPEKDQATKLDNHSVFFKEVPFHEAKKFTEASSEHLTSSNSEKEKEYLWVPVRRLLDINPQDTTLSFTPLEGFYAVNADSKKEVVADQSINFNLNQSFLKLLSQKEVQEYLKDKIIEKPLPRAVINKMKTNIKIKEKSEMKDSLTGIAIGGPVMFDKHAEALLGENSSQDSKTNLDGLILLHNNYGESQLQQALKYSRNIGNYAFYQITTEIENILFKMIIKEKEFYPWFVFYHAVPADIYQVYQIFKEFRSLIAGKSLNQNEILRGLDSDFNLIQNIEDFYNKATEDYQKSSNSTTLDTTAFFRKRALSVNMALFGGLEETIDSSRGKAEYSLHRWLAGYSDIDNSTISQDLTIQFFSRLGIPTERAARYQQLYNQYFLTAPVNFENIKDIEDVMKSPDKRKYGVMLQLFINPAIIDQVIYLAGAGGEKLSLKKEETISQYLTDLRSKPAEKNSFNERQIRLFLKPEYFHNPQYVKSYAYLSKEIGKGQEIQLQEYNAKLKNLVEEDVAFLLASAKKIDKEEVGENQSLIELHERVTGDTREQVKLMDSKIVEWFTHKQNDLILDYYQKNPMETNKSLKNTHNLFYSEAKNIPSEKAFTPLQLSLIHKNIDLFLYFLDKLPPELYTAFLSQKLPIDHGYMIHFFDPLTALNFIEFDTEVLTPILYKKFGNILLNYLFILQNSDSIMEIIQHFNNDISVDYLENLFLMPTYLRGLKHFSRLRISEDKCINILNKFFENMWNSFKESSFFKGNNLSFEEQRYYNIIFKGTEKNYIKIAEIYLLNKFTLSSFENFLKEIKFDQLNEEDTQSIFSKDLSMNFIEDSIKRFLLLIKPRLSIIKPKYYYQISNPIKKLMYDFKKVKESTLNDNEKKIFNIYIEWVSRLINEVDLRKESENY